MLYPKPQKHKQQKASRNKRLERGYICEICHNHEASSTHEVFSGSSNSNNSKKYGMQLRLCADCHREWHEVYTKADKLPYKIEFQKQFNKLYPGLDFYAIFKKNYI